MKTFLTILYSVLIFTCSGQNDTLSVYFNYDLTGIGPDQMKVLEEFKLKLHKGEIMLHMCKVYSDTSGTKEYNIKLSQRRLTKVFKLLSIDESWLKLPPRIYGDQIPKQLLANYSDEKFRRVDIFYRENKVKKPPVLAEAFAKFMDDNVSEATIEFSILFEAGTEVLLIPDHPQLKELTLFMLENPSVHAHIRGHVCCGPHLGLSRRRADRIMLNLITDKIPQDRLSAKGYSNTIPLFYPELTDEHSKRNRRVDIVFTKVE